MICHRAHITAHTFQIRCISSKRPTCYLCIATLYVCAFIRIDHVAEPITTTYVMHQIVCISILPATVCKYASRMSSHEYPSTLLFNRNVSGVNETDTPKNHKVFHTLSVMTSLRYGSCEHPPVSVELSIRRGRNKDGHGIRTFSMRASALPWRHPAPLLPWEIEKSTGLPSLTMKNLRRGQQQTRLVYPMEMQTSMSASGSHDYVLFPTAPGKEKQVSPAGMDSRHQEE